MADQKDNTYRLSAIPERFLAALQYKDYRTLWMANLFAGAAGWALIVARGWLAFDMTETNSSMWVGVVTFMAMAPRFFLTPVIGFIADKFNRQTVLSWTYGLNLAHNIILAALVMYGDLGIWLLVFLSVVNGSLRSAQQTTSQTLVPNLIPRDRLLNAVALNEATQQGSRLFGPILIFILIVAVPDSADIALSFWFCSAFYFIGLILTLNIHTRSTGVMDSSRSFFQNMASGLVYTYQHPMLLGIVIMAVAHCSLTMSYESMMPAISEGKLGAGEAGFSYLIAGVGAGALVSSIFLAGIRNESTRGKVFLFFGMTSGLGPIALGLSNHEALSIAATIFMGVNQAGFMTITHAIIQTIAPDEIRGRISGVYNMHVGGTMAMANLINGTLTDVFNAPLVLSVGGIIFIVVIFSSIGISPLRKIYFPRTPLGTSMA